MKIIEEQRIEVRNELVKIGDAIKLLVEGMKKFAFYGLTDEKVKEYYSTLKLETNPEKRWIEISVCTENKNVTTCIFYWRAVRDTLQYFMNEKYYFYRSESRCGIMDDNGNWLLQIRW